MFGDIINLLLTSFFYIFILIVFLRFLFQLLHVDFYNPISQFVATATNPILQPLRKLIPGKARVDSASLFAIVILKVMELGLRNLIQYGVLGSPFKLAALSVMSLTEMLLNFYLFAIFAQIILSWLAPHNNNPAIGILYQITEPVLRPARNLIPPMGGLDLSPILVILGIQVIELLLLHPNGLLPLFFGTLGKAIGAL